MILTRFYAYYLSRKGQSKSQEFIVSRLLRVVREKLCGRTGPQDSPATLNVSSIAVLSARFLLDLHPAASTAQEFEAELVRSHMRVVFSVSRNRAIISTGSPSEPLVAEAAAEIMHSCLKNSSKPYMDVWKLLVQFVDGGLVAQGTIGELIGRVLSIFAMDEAIQALTDWRELKYQTPVTVAAYYKALLTDDAWEALRQSVPINRTNLSKESGTKSFEDAFAGAYFHFSHYGKANDTTPMNDKHAWALWLRGVAILCQHNHKLTDRAIPIFFSNLGTLSPESVSMEFDQDKTGHSENPRTVPAQSAEALGFFSGENRLPYIAAVHCYGMTKDQGLTVTTPSAYDFRGSKVDKEAPRYQIDFSGLTAYRKVTTEMAKDIRRLIDRSKNELFVNHPRPYGQHILRQMLPVHDGNPDSQVWYSGLRKRGRADGGGKRVAASQRNGAGPSTKRRRKT